MGGNMTPDTAGALLQASQNQTSNASSKLQNSKTIYEIERTAKEFEAVFVTAMLKPMFDGVDISDSPFGGGKGEEIFNGMMLEEYGKSMTNAGGIGLADDIKRELIRMQGLEQEAAPQIRKPIKATIQEPTAEELNNINVGE